MAKYLNPILQTLKNSNYLEGTCAALNGNIHCESSLLKNGFKLRDQLLVQLLNMPTNWSTQCGDVRKIDHNLTGKDSRISFLQKIYFQKASEDLYNENVVNIANSVTLKTLCNSEGHLVSKDSIFYGSESKTILVTDFFVTAENDLFRYNNLQRERKIWWMRFSADPSRYSVEPYQLIFDDEILKESKSMAIKAKFAYGSFGMESIFLLPLHRLESFNKLLTQSSTNISLIRSVINLDLTASALIFDASIRRSESNNYTLMLNRKLAPYQVLLGNLHKGDKTVDELTIHLQHIISKSGLRLYDNFIRCNFQTEFEKMLLQSDSLGIPYMLVVNDESIKSGLLKMRSRDTTLFETIHISDIPNYLIQHF